MPTGVPAVPTEKSCLAPEAIERTSESPELTLIGASTASGGVKRKIGVCVTSGVVFDSDSAIREISGSLEISEML